MTKVLRRTAGRAEGSCRGAFWCRPAGKLLATVPFVRIAVATWFPDDPGAPRGGVESVSATLVRALAGLPGIDVDVFTFTRRAFAPALEQWQGARIHRTRWPGGPMLTTALGEGRRRLAQFLARVEPDVVHAHDTFGVMARGLRRPRVLTIHGFIHEDTLVGGRRFAALRSRLWRRVEQRAWAAFPQIISISPYVRERLRGVARGQIVDIENPIEPLFFERRAWLDGPPIIFSAGVLCRRKNTLALVDALALVRKAGLPARLRIAGATTEPAYGQQVEYRIRQLGLEDCVDMLGSLQIADVAAELEHAMVFALVSREENAPLGVQEAMAVGVPVVASNRCGMPYQIREGETGFLVDAEDPATIAARCLRLLTDGEFRRRASAASRAAAQERFHPAVVAQRTVEVYRRALAGVRAVAPIG